MTEYKKIFIDTAPFMYYLEENEQFCDTVSKFFLDNADAQFITSSITVMEYLVLPKRDKNKKLVDDFYDFLNAVEIKIVPTDVAIADKAADIRAEHTGYKGLDSIQLATAVYTGCDLFYTNDKQLKRFDEIETLVVSEQ